MFVITRFRYIAALFNKRYYHRGKENRLLYRGLRCIEVPLYQHALILYLNREKAKSNYHSRSPILNVEACFDTLDEKCSVEEKCSVVED